MPPVRFALNFLIGPFRRSGVGSLFARSAAVGVDRPFTLYMLSYIYLFLFVMFFLLPSQQMAPGGSIPINFGEEQPTK